MLWWYRTASNRPLSVAISSEASIGRIPVLRGSRFDDEGSKLNSIQEVEDGQGESFPRCKRESRLRLTGRFWAAKARHGSYVEMTTSSEAADYGVCCIEDDMNRGKRVVQMSPRDNDNRVCPSSRPSRTVSERNRLAASSSSLPVPAKRWTKKTPKRQRPLLANQDFEARGDFDPRRGDSVDFLRCAPRPLRPPSSSGREPAPGASVRGWPLGASPASL